MNDLLNKNINNCCKFKQNSLYPRFMLNFVVEITCVNGRSQSKKRWCSVGSVEISDIIKRKNKWEI